MYRPILLLTDLLWQVSNENLGSDHLMIKMSISYENTPNFIKKRNFKLADWENYKRDTSFTGYNFDNDNVQEQYDFFENEIIKAADKNIPFIKLCNNPQRQFKPKEYWSPQLSQIVAQRRLALKQFRRNPTPNNLHILQNKTKEAQQMIRNAKSQSWQRFCSRKDETSSVSDMWRQMRWVKGRRQSRHHVPKDKLEELLCTLAPDTVLEAPPYFYFA